MAENNQNRPDNYYVSQSEPPSQSPPVLESGAIKWVRENLFNSALNTVLTILGILVVFYSVNGLMTWVIQDANWFSVSANIRNLMLGRYESEYEWRASLTLYFTMFAFGAAIAVWIRQIARLVFFSIVLIIFTLQVAPRIINSVLDLPPWYAGAGNIEIAVAQTTEVAFDQIGFIGQENDEIRIRLASDAVSNDQSLSNINGFVDNIANALRNQAQNRLDTIAIIEEYQRLIDEHEAALANGNVPVLTETQYAEYMEEVESTDIPEMEFVELYNVNQIPVLVEILDPETLEPLGSAVLTDADDVFSLTLPVDGWYILSKELVIAEDVDLSEVDAEVEENGEALTLLNVQGIYPVSKRESTQSLNFTRRPDGFSIANVDAPQYEGERVPFVDIIRNQYRGERSFSDYLRTYVSPFLHNIANYVSLVLLIGIAGYAATEILRNVTSMAVASKFATYLLMATPVVLWVLVNGMYINSVIMWLLAISMSLTAYLLYKLVQRDGYQQSYLIAGGIAYVLFAGALFLSQGFDLPDLLTILPLLIADAAVPRFVVWLGIIFIPLAIYLGKAAHIPGEKVSVNVPLIGGLAAILYLIVVVATLGDFINVDTRWFLQPSDPRGWGGLLLTVMLTVYGIIIAFPIGVGLALGRRSDLPLIKYLCTAYIELVRGSPFITVLFFMQLFIPLINSDFNQIPGSYRAIAATIAFSAAYLAENVRGGLQSLPPGQSEAAKALGLNPWQAVTLITLPQALRAVIPALVGQFISLFKDTSLVTIVGLIDLVGFVNAMVVQAEFIGTRLEGLLFISILYFVVSYLMSYVSRLLEASGSGSTRRM
ncbi:MAG: amino acid ABC transporter permease [Anaerolineae bacterium]